MCTFLVSFKSVEVNDAASLIFEMKVLKLIVISQWLSDFQQSLVFSGEYLLCSGADRRRDKIL